MYMSNGMNMVMRVAMGVVMTTAVRVVMRVVMGVVVTTTVRVVMRVAVGVVVTAAVGVVVHVVDLRARANHLDGKLTGNEAATQWLASKCAAACTYCWGALLPCILRHIKALLRRRRCMQLNMHRGH